jgi:hypothetical protein
MYYTGSLMGYALCVVQQYNPAIGAVQQIRCIVKNTYMCNGVRYAVCVPCNKLQHKGYVRKA